MRVLFAGTPSVAIPTLQRLLHSNHEVVGVITAPPAPAGRGRKLTPSDVATFAIENGLQVFEFENINADSALEALQALDADVAVVVAYGQLLKTAVLDSVRHGWINLHFSLLPQWRGAAPVQHAILAGDELTGASTFRIESGLDTGPVFGQLTTEIRQTETAGELLSRLSHDGAELMFQTLELIASEKAALVAQSAEDVSYAPKITVAQAQIEWTNPALAITRQIRAFNPSPFAWTEFDNAKLLIGKAAITTESNLGPGQISVSKNQVWVGTGSFDIELIEVKPAGKGWMNAADWARGVRSDDWKFGG